MAESRPAVRRPTIPEGTIKEVCARRALGLSLEQLSQEFKIDRSYVGKLLAGKVRPKVARPVVPTACGRLTETEIDRILAEVLAVRRNAGTTPSGRRMSKLLGSEHFYRRPEVTRAVRRVGKWLDRLFSYVKKGLVNECWKWHGGTLNRPHRKPVPRYMRGPSKSFDARKLIWQLGNSHVPEGSRLVWCPKDPLCCNPHHFTVRRVIRRAKMATPAASDFTSPVFARSPAVGALAGAAD